MKQTILFLICALLGTSTFAQLQFENLANMPAARGAVTSAADSNAIYVANGYSKTVNYTSEVEKYDISSNTWELLTKKTIPKRFASSAVVGGKLYIFNGLTAHGALNEKVEVVDLATGEVDYAAVNPNPVYGGGVAVWEGQIYAFGGARSAKEFSDKLFKFDPATNTWTALASMPEAKEARGAIVDGHLYTLGGYNGKQSSEVAMYDLHTGTWAHVADLPVKVSGHAVAVNGTDIYLVGDYTDLARLGYFDTRTRTYHALQSNMTGRRHAASHILDGKLYVAGGNRQTPITTSLSKLEAASIVTAD